MNSNSTGRPLILFFAVLPLAYAQNIEVYSSGTVEKGTTRQLSAYVPLSPNTIKWSVNDVQGGNSTVGTISSSGLYTAPIVVPAANVVTVKATSTAYPAKFGSAKLTLTQKKPSVWSSNPSSFPGGTVTLSINGANFEASTIIKVGAATWTATYISPTSMKATGSITTAGTYPLTATNPGKGAAVSSPINVTVTPAPPPPPPAISLVSPGSIQQGAYSLTVSGSGFTAGSQVHFNGAAITTVYVSASSLTATGSSNLAIGTTIPITVANPVPNAATSNTFNIKISAAPAPNMSKVKAGRLLEQAAFGPTPAMMDKVLQDGVDAWINEQLALPETVFAAPASMSDAQSQLLHRYGTAPDQLRQRMIQALANIVVISANKNIYAPEIVPYYQILSRNALGNYKTLLEEISTSSQMGKFLDHANSSKATPKTSPNENYPRELLQLFSVGLYQLNADGTNKLDPQGQPIPTYNQTTISEFARALTGWTYPGSNATGFNWENFSGPLQPRDNYHDTGAKTLLNGAALPAGQNTTQDMAGVINSIFNHPNTGPFVVLRLIRALVTSNPGPAYVQRVSAVFDNNGAGVRGDLKAVAKAILTDVEARNDTPPATFGRLKDAIFHVLAFTRALGGAPRSGTHLQIYNFVNMQQAIMNPPSVFGYYSPFYRVPKQPLFGPEFQIYSPSESVVRAGMFANILNGQASGDFPVNLAPFTTAAGNTPALIDAVDQALLYGRMSPQMRSVLTTAIDAQYDNNGRVFTALYLTALSGQYAVAH